MTSTNYRTWAEIDLDSLAHNIHSIRKVTGANCEIMAAVKADAYGHGVIACSKEMISCGVNRFAVATLDEAIELRHAGITEPILVLNHIDESLFSKSILFDVTHTVYTYKYAELLSNSCKKLNKKSKVHIKIDTGMGRIGFPMNKNTIDTIKEISSLPFIIIEGIYSHFSTADTDDKEYCKFQYDNFTNICNELERENIEIPYKHIANSAAICNFPDTHFNIVRPGIILYGLLPSNDFYTNSVSLKPVMTLKSTVLYIKELDSDMSISYGRNFITDRKSKIATIAVGYGDGYMRALSGKASVIINRERAPVVGNICMDQCMVDITDMKVDVNVGDEVILFGKDLPANDVAEQAGTISYEIVTSVGRRVPRVYIKNGKIENVLNYLL